jgi:hypothetical protein
MDRNRSWRAERETEIAELSVHELDLAVKLLNASGDRLENKLDVSDRSLDTPLA